MKPAASAIVLAGGRSQRLGMDKAAITVGGIRVLNRVLSVLTGLFDDIVVVGRSVWQGAPTGVRFLEDQTPGQGPLGGLWTGLGAIRHERALVVGCDMPFLAGDLLRELLAQSGRADATVTRTGEQVQPLLAVYDRRVRPLVEQLLASKDRSLMALLRAIDVCHVDVGVGEWGAFSINSPQDLSRARKFIKERKASMTGVLGKLRAKSKVWLELDGQPVFGDGKAGLLQALAEGGSIRAAAQQLGMSYRAAWGRLRVMERRLGRTLLVRRAGGRGGGGSQLTPFGTELLRRYLRFRRGLNEMVNQRFERAVAKE